MENQDFTGCNRVVLPKGYFGQPKVYLGGAMEDVDVKANLVLDGLATPVYARTTAWLALVIAGCLIPFAAG